MSARPDFRLDGRLALVTGGGRGLGRAIADGLAATGARVVATSRDARRAAELGERYGTAPCALDVRDVNGIRAAVAALADREGPVDVLINNAGTNVPQPALEVDEDSWDEIQTTNVKGCFFTAQAVAAQMVRAGRSGTIVNIGSQAGTVGIEDRSAYCASKGAVEQLTKVLAIELASHDITVNCVAPTFIETELTASTLARPDVRERILARMPLGRLGQPEDVVGAVVFLAGPSARLITGSTLAVDGGWTAW